MGWAECDSRETEQRVQPYKGMPECQAIWGVFSLEGLNRNIKENHSEFPDKFRYAR